ncbi:MAG: hypothetical protein LBB79_00810, partial [Prevotellaceae bacterium]|nr:hypothetical protein [Prevotellaceae bacterium]
MKKNYFIWMFAALLLSVGIITACEEDEIEEQTKFVDVTITVTLPETYEGLSFADVGLDSIKVTAGDDVFYTDTTGKVSASVKEGAYSLNASLTEIVVGLNSTGSNGLHTVKFQGIATADFSEANKTAAIALRVSGTPEFTAFGAIADILEDDTIHLWYKGDTIDLAPLFKAQLAEGDTRTLSFSYEVAAQPKKSETGGNATGQWVDLLQSYAIADDGHSLVAIDSIGAVAFDLTAITGKKREISPAVVRVTVKAAGDLIAQKEFPVVQDSVIKE